jgi:NitT/TauT family transport system ATP-binding protein
MSQPKLIARDVTVEYHNTRTGNRLVALDRISLEINEGEFACIVGPSGCGKTTFLNAVDGLQAIDSGSLTLDGREIKKPGPDRAMVFQHASLLPWRTVLGNVMYGLELRGTRKSEARERALHFTNLVGLTGFEGAYPSELSGGMQQRCNLARALATDPEILLLDEPFAALDPQTREFMQAELLKIWSKARKTALFITHQINEAIYLADRVFVFGSRPGQVRDVIEIDLPRPRPLRVKRDPHFLEIEDRIWEQIKAEVLKAGTFQLDEEDDFTDRPPVQLTPVA